LRTEFESKFLKSSAQYIVFMELNKNVIFTIGIICAAIASIIIGISVMIYYNEMEFSLILVLFVNLFMTYMVLKNL